MDQSIFLVLSTGVVCTLLRETWSMVNKDLPIVSQLMHSNAFGCTFMVVQVVVALPSETEIRCASCNSRGYGVGWGI